MKKSPVIVSSLVLALSAGIVVAPQAVSGEIAAEGCHVRGTAELEDSLSVPAAGYRFGVDRVGVRDSLDYHDNPWIVADPDRVWMESGTLTFPSPGPTATNNVDPGKIVQVDGQDREVTATTNYFLYGDRIGFDVTDFNGLPQGGAVAALDVLSNVEVPQLHLDATFRPTTAMTEGCGAFQLVSGMAPAVHDADGLSHPTPFTIGSQGVVGAEDFGRLSVRAALSDADYDTQWELHKDPGAVQIEKIEGYVDGEGVVHLTVPQWMNRAFPEGVIPLEVWAAPRADESVTWSHYAEEALVLDGLSVILTAADVPLLPGEGSSSDRCV
ncbi:hypothetical protein [Corynebacterium nasicanis]|uniref:Htaa domain-containing protein n=1 Tax=Corynebacterium nasicanis TaxID=1448267 RepID=A0ABW1QFJ0_9CORY